MTRPLRAGKHVSPSPSSLAVSVTSLVAALLVSGPAAGLSAATDAVVAPATQSQCASGTVCLWSATFYSGSFFSTSATSATNVAVFTVARSAWNNSSKAAYVYSGSAGSGFSVCLAPGSKATSTSHWSSSARLSTSASC
ncbi:peptidase inhibitor family I36 protein [Sanguibacter suarezii]|uniref:peptidase inhibitor family I36 protein n=1 Tax=Sanguibacter suarezii TaxID=60921 RepID=UPI000A04B2E6